MNVKPYALGVVRSCSSVFIAGRATPARTRHTRGVVGRIVLLPLAAAAAFAVPAPASAHQNPCHRAHTCPSDHATYPWRGQWCVRPGSDKRTAKFKTRVVFGGKTYYCHR